MINQFPYTAFDDPTLFISPDMKRDITAIKQRKFRWMDQPLWSQQKISFTSTDRTNRRKLIEALITDGASDKLISIGYQLLICSRTNRCGSPLCNFCRTHLQDLYQKRVLQYFKDTHRDDLIWLTVLDDLIYDPGIAVPARIKQLRISMRALFKRQFQKQVRAFGAFEIDVKRPDQVSNENGATDLLKKYGLRDEPEVAFMPHLHAIIALDGISPDDFAENLRTQFQKPSQVSISSLRTYKTKEDNLATLARYSFKFRYQFADNILRERPSYGNRFDDETLRSYTQLVHSIKGQRGAIGFEFRYNLNIS